MKIMLLLILELKVPTQQSVKAYVDAIGTDSPAGILYVKGEYSDGGHITGHKY